MASTSCSLAPASYALSVWLCLQGPTRSRAPVLLFSTRPHRRFRVSVSAQLEPWPQEQGLPFLLLWR